MSEDQRDAPRPGLSASAALLEAADAMQVAREQAIRSRQSLRGAVRAARVIHEASRARLDALRATWSSDAATARDDAEVLRGQVKAALTEISAAVQEVAARARPLEEKAHELDVRSAELENLSLRLAEAEGALAEGLNGAEQALDTMNAATVELLEQADERVISLEQHLTTWSAKGRDESHALIERVAQLTTHVDQRSEHFESDFGALVGEKLSVMDQTFMTTALQALASASSDARQSFALLSSTNHESVSEFSSAMDTIRSKVRTIIEIIQSIRPLLEAARAVL